MPTFDFSNIIARIVRATLKTVKSPLAIFVTLATGLGVLASSVVRSFDIDSFVIDWFSSNLFPSLDPSSNSILNNLLYVINFDAFLSVFNMFVQFVITFIPFIVTALSTLFVLKMAFTSSMLFRETIRDWVS